MEEYWFVFKFGALTLLAASCTTVPPLATPLLPHRSLNIEEWRSSNAFADAYVPQVQRDNVVSLKGVAVPFAIYINEIHSRLHSSFGEELQAAREAYPELRTAADLIVHVEIVLDQENGRLARLGVFKSSGSSVFDAVALAALRRAAPFGAPPPSIVSPGGKVYIHWDLHTDPFEACATRNTRPYLLARAPQ
jgi:TonB family protein